MKLFETITASLRLLWTHADTRTRWQLAATVSVVAAASSLSAAAPLALKELVDALATRDQHSAMATAIATGSLYAVALCTARLLGELRPWLAGTIEQRLSAGLRSRFFTHLLSLPLAFHHQQRSGALVQTINQATTGTRMMMNALVGAILPVMIEVGCMAVVLSRLDQPALVACFFLSALAYLAVFAVGATRLGRRSNDVVQASLATQAVLADQLVNCEALKCNNAEGHAAGKLAGATAQELAGWALLHRQRAWLGAGSVAVFAAAIGSCLLLSGRAVASGQLTLGGFVLANAYILQIVRPLEALGAGARDLIQAAAWIRPLLDVLELSPEGLPKPTSAPQPWSASPPASLEGTNRALAASLAATRLAFAHRPGRMALDGIDFDLTPGRTLAIVGASGSGKSTLIRLILRLHDPQQGSIFLNGTAIESMPPSVVRQTIGFVPQDTTLFHDTLAANIALGRADATPDEILHAAKLAGLGELISSLPDGCDTIVGERGLKLSGGERQRVSIARAVLRRPSLLLFDEATSMLDSATEAAVMRNIKAASTGCTTVIVAHRLSTVAHADEIIVLDKGVIVERGDHHQLLTANGLYARAWHAQHPPNGPWQGNGTGASHRPAPSTRPFVASARTVCADSPASPCA